MVGSRDYNIRQNFLTTVLIWSDLIFLKFENLKVCGGGGGGQ